jgi:hypothetical protein
MQPFDMSASTKSSALPPVAAPAISASPATNNMKGYSEGE